MNFDRMLWSRIFTLLATLILGASFTACGSDVKDPADEGVAEPEYTLLDEHALAVGTGSTRFALVDQQPAEMRFKVELGELLASDYRTPGGPYTRLEIPGFQTIKHVGLPELPVMNRLIAIPHGTRAEIEIVSQEIERISLVDAGVALPVMPAQPGRAKCGEPNEFVCEQSAYSESRIEETLVSVIPQGRMRNVNVGLLQLAPVAYLPRTNELEVVTSIEFKVTFVDMATRAPDPYNPYAESPFFDAAYGLVAGSPQYVRSGQGNLVRDVVTMVIVTPPQFVDALSEYVAWKTLKGFKVVTAVTGTPAVGSTKEQIKAYIAKLYNEANAENPAPSFVLFIGDIEQLPTWQPSSGEGKTDYSDRPYCEMADDLIPDMYYGRLSATNVDQLKAELEKTLKYDQLSMADLSYFAHAVLIAGVDSSYAPTYGNGQINYGAKYFFNAAHGITPHVYLYPASGSSAAAVKTDVSNGAGFVNYTAHGSNTSWADPSFTQADIRALRNQDKYGIVIGNCCLTSSYQVTESFSETWLRTPKVGAVGYIGGSNSTYWDEDYWFGVGSGAISANPTFEGTGYGAYDGLFHDHGEPIGNWFTTADSIIFAGNLAVMEGGSSRVAYYWNIYNLSGDPSLFVHTRVPLDNEVTLPAKLFTNKNSLAVTAAPGSYVGITQDGVLIGAGTIKAEGNAEIGLWQRATPGKVHVVITAQNRKTFQADLDAADPAVVALLPATINANAATQVQVTVREADGVTAMPNALVFAEGLGYTSETCTTNNTGACTLIINYPYGPELKIRGQRATDTAPSFEAPLAITAAALPTPDLKVQTTFGLADSFAYNLPGTLVATVGVDAANVKLFATVSGNVVSAAGTQLELTASSGRLVTGTIAVAGYNVYTESFPVITAYGTLVGKVDQNGTAQAGVKIRLTDEANALVAETVTDASGNYGIRTEFPVGSYLITADKFGALHYEADLFVGYGENTHNIQLTPAANGTIKGVVKDAKTGAALKATVRAFRNDTQEVVAEVQCLDNGTYALPSLTLFSYVIEARASRHIAVRQNVALDSASVTVDFALQPTVGDILILEDSPDNGKAIADRIAALGYGAKVEEFGTSAAANWQSYDMLVVTAGESGSALQNATQRAALRSFVKGGGVLLIEGGEIGYAFRTQDPDFMKEVLHASNWIADKGGNMVPKLTTHALLNKPNKITGNVTFNYGGYGDEDGVTAATDAQVVATWSENTANASLIAYAPTTGAGRIVYMPFDYTAMDANVAPKLLQNTLAFLLGPREATGLTRGSLLINEVLADPPTGVDVNGDGTASTIGDEFVEIINISAETLDLTGVRVSDATAYKMQGFRYQFPDGTQLAPNAAIVVWGSMAPLALSNTGDSVYLTADATVIDSVSYGAEAGHDVSITREVEADANAAFVLHTATSRGSAYSPGTRSDGSSF